MYRHIINMFAEHGKNFIHNIIQNKVDHRVLSLLKTVLAFHSPVHVVFIVALYLVSVIYEKRTYLKLDLVVQTL